MSIINHPCTNTELGAFTNHKIINVSPEGEAANWVCFFCYEHGIVRQESISNSRLWKYDTFLDTETTMVGLTLEGAVEHINFQEELEYH